MGIRLDRFRSDFCVLFCVCQVGKADHLDSAFFASIDGMNTTNHGVLRRLRVDLFELERRPRGSTESYRSPTLCGVQSDESNYDYPSASRIPAMRILSGHSNDTSSAHEAADRSGCGRLQFVADDSGDRKKARLRV